MFSRLLKDASLYSVSSLISRGLSLITVPLFTRVLSPADYGALDLLSTLMVIAPMLIGLALDQAISRFYLDAEDELERKRIASTVLFYNVLIFAALIPIALPVTSWISDVWLAGQIDRATAVMVFVYIWIHSVFITGNNQLRYIFKSKQYAFCHIGNVLLSTSLSILFVFFLKWGIIGVIIGQSIGQLVFGLLSVYLSRECYSLLFHWPSFKRMLIYSLPLVPSTISFYAMQILDRIFLNELRDLQDVGLYSIGSRLASLVNLFLMGFHGAWWPMVMKSFRDESAKKNFLTVFNYYLFATMMILAGISLFSEEILLILTTKEFSDGFIVVPMLVLSAVLASIAAYFTYGIQIEKKSNYRLIINIVTLTINCVLNYLLIPVYGIIGAALATSISYAFLAAVGMMVSQQLYYVPYRWSRIISAILLSCLVAGSVVVFDVPVSLYFLVAKLCAAVILFAVLAWLLNIRIRDILSNGIFAIQKNRRNTDTD